MIAGRYRLIGEVGRGGMGAVWHGVDEVLGRDVALKALQPVESGGAPTVRAAREAQLAARLNHRHVVAVFDLVEDDGRPWLVMEYVDGSTLRGVVDRDGPLSPDAAAKMLGPVAAGLRAAHDAGIVHRDVKPSNILVSPNGQVKLGDFGIARGTGNDMTLTQTGMVTGSPAYLAPEVARGHPATPASDVWSLGATLFFTVTGRAPYDMGNRDENVMATMYRIVHDEPPRTELAGRLAPALEGAMTRDPELRWSMAEMHRFLTASPEQTQVLTAATRPAEAPGGPAIAPEPKRRARWVPAALSGLVILALCVGAFALALRLGDDDNPSGSSSRSPSSGQSTSPSTSPSPTPADEPTDAGVRAFVEDYLGTAPSDPAAGFAMLTPEFQEASGGIDGYQAFWGEMRGVDQIHSIVPEVGDDVGVSYQYTYTMDDGSSHTEDVHLDLAYEDGTYLIAGE